MVNQVAHSSNAAPPLLVRTQRAALRLEGKAEYRIGRDPRSDVELADPRVSWDHATLRTEGGTWVLEDPGPGRAPSRNGTYRNGERVARLEISGECVVRFGNPDDGVIVRFAPQFEQQPQPPQDPRPPGLAAESFTGTNAAYLPGVDREPTKRLPLPAKVMRIGRLPGNDLVISDISVSKNHAELRKSASGQYAILDLGSHNGTYVNGVRVHQVELTEDDIISIGHSTFRLADGELREYVDDGRATFEAHDLLVRVHDGGKEKILLQGVTFPLAERSMLAVLGPAGAGKSTLLNALTGKRPATEGHVLYDYRDLYDSYDELKHRIGLVPQQSVTHDQLTARTALGYAAELRFPSDTREAERSQRVDEVLDALDMTPHKDTRIERLSGGQQKRVNIGLELLTKPSLLFLDEPTSPLDPHLKRELFQQMRKMADKDAPQGQSVVVITHDVESKLIDQCDRIIVLVPGGRMAYFGPSKEGLKYFKKDDWADVFALFAAEPNRDWMGEYKASADYVKYVAAPMDERLRASLPPKRRDEDTAKPRQRGRFTQVLTMARRYARVTSVDRGYLTFTVLLPLILGLLVRVMPAPEGLAGAPHTNAAALTKLLILVMAAVLSGMANAIREFIKERDIFERERMAGLSAGAYLMSKVLVLGVISVLQTVLIVIIGLAGVMMPAKGAFLPGPPFIEIALAVALLSVVAMLMGLAISTLVSKGDQTMPALVMLTMVQVVLSGGVFPLTGVASYFSDIAPSRWGMGALASTIDMNTLNQGQQAQDLLWAHSASQWLTDMVVLLLIGLICLTIARYRLGRIGPRRRR